MSGKLSFTDARSVFANRQFAAYTIGNFLSHVGDWAAKLAVGWLTWQLTHSPAWLGIILFWDLAPTLLISPIGGAVVDRMDRLLLTRITVVLSMLQPIVLSIIYFVGWLNIWVLLVGTIYLGTVNAFGQTTRLAIVPLLVPERDIPRAAPISSISFNMARFLGPALFGLIVLITNDPGYGILLNALTFAVFLWVMCRLDLREEALNKASGKGLAADVWEGVRYALTHPGVGPLLIVLVVSSVGTRAFLDLLPGFAGGVFGRGPEALSIMTSAVGLGALTGAIYLLMRPSIIGLATVAMYGSGWVGVGLIIFTMIDHFWIGVACLYFVGIGLSTSAVGVLTILQTCVSGPMRGRALSIYGIIFRGGPALGGLIMGWIAEWTGLAWPVAGGGLICVLAWIWVLGQLKSVNRNIAEHVAKNQ
ncbi:MAG: putative MFS family arabinose efflux permease [Alphaproteobacteria bacterium]|jgi:predicted MFS family arabinose efflux permease